MSSKRKDGPQNKAKNRPGVYDAGDIGVANADERKTVILDSELEGLEFDDKVWLFWRRNKNFIVALVAIVFISAAASGLWKSFDDSSKNALSANYAAAVSADEKAQFAADNSGKALAGVALLDNADAFFADGKFEEAADAYVKAAANLEKTILHGRAVLGHGVSLVKSGKDEGFAVIGSIENKDNAGVYGAEASYHLAMEDLSKGRRDDAKARFEKLAANSFAGQWANVAQDYLMRLGGE